jgi:hypothetical protein
MGYELSLQPTRRGPLRDARNPFTGAVQPMAPLEMSPEELHAALAVLERHGGKLDARGGGLVRLERAMLEFSGFGLTGDLVKVSGDLAGACACLFDLATAGQLVIAPDDGAFVTTAEALARARDLEDELGTSVLVASVEELVTKLAPNQAAAMAYAARVT